MKKKIVHIYPTADGDNYPHHDPTRSLCYRLRYRHPPVGDDSELCEECYEKRAQKLTPKRRVYVSPV